METQGEFFQLLMIAGYIILLGGSLVSRRILFAAVAAVAMVCFSECAYWYKKGFDEIYVYERAVIYLYPTFFCLWAIQAFNVRRLAPLFLCAAIYGLSVEGGLVWIIFENGNWSPMSIVNTPLNWHAPFSVIFGWYFLRRAILMDGKKGWGALAAGCIAFGIFWGIWSTYQWMPDTIAEMSQEEETRFLGKVPVLTFGLYTLMITAMLGLAHWVMGGGAKAGRDFAEQREFPVFTLLPRYWLGQGVWRASFKAHFIEAVAIVVWMWAWHVAYCLPNAFKTIAGVNAGDPSSVAKLPIAMGIILIALWANRAQENQPNVLEQLRGTIPLSRIWLLVLMPLAATVTYGVCYVMDPSADFIEKYFYMGTVIATSWFGFTLFILSLVLCFLPPYYRWDRGKTMTASPDIPS